MCLSVDIPCEQIVQTELFEIRLKLRPLDERAQD